MDNFNFILAKLDVDNCSSNFCIGMPDDVEKFLNNSIGDDFVSEYSIFRDDIATAFSVFFNYIIHSLKSKGVSYSEFLDKIKE